MLDYPLLEAVAAVDREGSFEGADPEGNFWEIACAPPDNPVVAASRRAAGMALGRKRLKPGRKAGRKGAKKAKQSASRRRVK